MPTALEVHEQISQQAPLLQETKVKETCEIGKGIRQGDLYIVRLNPTGNTKLKGLEEAINIEDCTMLGSDQLAPGKTQGSRHCIKEGQATFWIDPKNNNPVFGGVVKADGRWDLTHPEHADWNMPSGCYGVFYQLDWATKQRVKD